MSDTKEVCFNPTNKWIMVVFSGLIILIGLLIIIGQIVGWLPTYDPLELLGYLGYGSLLLGTLNITKIGTQITYTFTDIEDYNTYKDSYDNITGNTSWNNQSSNPDDRSYYNYIYSSDRIAPTCGDNHDYNGGIIWNDSVPFIFDAGLKTITINLTAPPAIPVEIDCDDLHDEVTYIVTDINNNINKPDYNINTNVRYNGFVGRYLGIIIVLDEYIPHSFNYSENHYSMIGVTPTGWGDVKYSSNLSIVDYGIDLQTGKCTITDMNDPINNFKIETILNPDGTYLALEDAITIYEIP